MVLRLRELGLGPENEAGFFPPGSQPACRDPALTMKVMRLDMSLIAWPWPALLASLVGGQ